MSQIISGPGLGLPLPQSLYPTQLSNAPIDISSNRVTLAPGDALPIPSGTWYIDCGCYCGIQYLDPITNTWSFGPTPGWIGGIQYVKSDGFTVRLANMLGCPIGAVVANAGSGYVQASTTIVATPGNSTWTPIVGGALTVVGGTLTSNGAGYGVAPLVLIPPPPPASNNSNGVGGVPASGYAVIANGTVSGFTFTNPGAGYPTAPTPIIVPNPTDPNIALGITAATLTLSLTASGSLTGAFCTNPGAPLANPANITLAIGGAGSSGSLTALVLQTVTVGSITTAGTGYGPASATILLTTVGGSAPAGAITNNPDALGLAFRPRPAQIGLALTGAAGTVAAQAGSIYDGGLFVSAPSAVVAPTGIPTTVATAVLTMGSRADTVRMQPAP